MSKLYDSLCNADQLKFITLDTFIKEISEDLLALYLGGDSKIKLKLDLQKISLDSDKTLNLGLIINEIVTNSLKYAFDKEDPKGTIKISLSSEYETIIVEIIDTGKGYPTKAEQENSTGYGTKIVDLLVNQMDAKMVKENNGGATTRISFKK